MSRLTGALLGMILLVPASIAGQSQALDQAVAQLRAGEYEDALSALRTLSRSPDRSVAVTRTYARALLEVGRYEEALRLLQDDGGEAARLELGNVLGEVFLSLGRTDEAEAAFRRAADGGAPDRQGARLNLGRLLWDRGDREEALALFDSFIDLYNGARARLSAEDLMAVGEAVRYLAVTNSDLYKDALLAFDAAAERDPDDLRPDLLAGELFLEKYRPTDARESVKLVLERNPRHPRALLAQAMILDFEGVGGSLDLVRKALEVNPRYVDARTFLAELFLKTEDYERAREEAEEALATNPVHLGALSALAASYFLQGDSSAYEEIRSRVHDLNPSYGALYTNVAEAAANQRQYQMAVDLATKAVELDPYSWRSYGVLGMNQLRTGAVEEGRRNLETAFRGDPYNPWYMNSLDLLDTFVRFEEVPTDHFRVFLNEEEANLLRPYAVDLAEEAFSALRDRYGAVPPTPIRLEIYPSHADFSVRTLGITGLGALGVSFGSTLVMDSPSAMEPGEFNWASTMWHEIAHAFHLAMSDHRVPRWFTEGLAVHEQHEARPYWGHRASPGWLQAYRSGRLLPVSRLNEGFIRPEYPQQVVFSYYQASLVFDLIESRWGLDAVVGMLEGYGQGKSTTEVFRETLGETPEDFDRLFDQYVKDHWGGQMEAVAAHPQEAQGVLSRPTAESLEDLRRRSTEAPGNFYARLALGRALVEAHRLEEAERELRAALGLFPEYGGAEGPYWYLARIHRERGELQQAAQALQQLGRLNENLPSIYLEEAELRLEIGDKDAAAHALEKVVEVVPFEMRPHEDLAALYEDLENFHRAVRERRAILALDPPDLAGAHFRLAVALARAGDPQEARSQVLRALELAPSYDEALELLLELKGIGGEAGGSLIPAFLDVTPPEWEQIP